MGSIHGRRPMLRNRNRRRQTPAGEYAVRLPQRRGVDRAPRAAQQTPIAHENVLILHARRSQPLGHRARACAPALVLQRNVLPDSILSRPAGRIEGSSSSESHPSIRGSVPLRRHFTATQDAVCRFFCQHCASAHAEAYCNSNRTAQISQNRPSYQNITARSVSLGAAWHGAAAPLFRDRIAAHVFPVQGTCCAAIVFG